MLSVGERIKEKRIALGWSQQELAKKAGYSDKTAISKIEHAGNEITLKQVKRIAKAMKVDPEELMGWPENRIEVSRATLHEEMEKWGDRGEALDEYAKKLYELYKNADPKIKQAVDLLLKADKQP